MSKGLKFDWSGTLTVNNIEQVCALLVKLLEGKTYTFIASSEASGFRPTVRTKQRLAPQDTNSKKAISIFYGDNGQYAGFNVSDTYGVWGCNTLTDKDEYDREFKNPYFSFEWNKVTITHRDSLTKNLVYRVAAVE